MTRDVAKPCREGCLLDGHNRYAICTKHNLPYTTRELSLPDLDTAKAWMLAHQLGRRNLTPLQASELRGRYKLLFGQKPGGDSKSEKSKPQNAAIMTDKAIADKHGVSIDTIQRALLLDSGVLCSRVVRESQLIFKAIEK